MSLWGRLVIDRMKRAVAPFLRLPVPPYQDGNYWNGVYRNVSPNDVFEWGNLSADDLWRYRYKMIAQWDEKSKTHLYDIKATTSEACIPTTTTLGETIGVYPEHNNDHFGSTNNAHSPSTTGPTNIMATAMPDSIRETENRALTKPIVILGCGNSRLGEAMVEAGWRGTAAGPILQVDIAHRVVQAISQRCAQYQVSGDMMIIQDDAMVLSAIHDNSINAVLDKGLVDAFFCASDHSATKFSIDIHQCYLVMQAIHRVLIPGGIGIIFSYSRPEFFLNSLLWGNYGGQQSLHEQQRQRAASTQSKILHPRRMWSNIQVRELDNILLYRFQKAIPVAISFQNSSRKRRRW